MSMYDCWSCGCNPCNCGYDYLLWTKEERLKLIKVLTNVNKIADEIGRVRISVSDFDSRMKKFEQEKDNKK